MEDKKVTQFRIQWRINALCSPTVDRQIAVDNTYAK